MRTKTNKYKTKEGGAGEMCSSSMQYRRGEISKPGAKWRIECVSVCSDLIFRGYREAPSFIFFFFSKCTYTACCSRFIKKIVRNVGAL